MNKFDQINAAIEDAEGSIITLATTIIPWLAPALPAWFTYSHLSEKIGVPFLVAVAMAVTVELLGLSAVSTAFQAMRHNKEHRADKRKVSLAFPIGAYAFYILVILVVNVVMEIPMNETGQKYAEIVSIGLLILISTPAFIIAIARQEQRQIDREYENSKSSNAIGKTGKDSTTPKRWTYQDFYDIQSKRNGDGPMTATEISEKGNRPLRTAYNWLEKYEKEHIKTT